MSEVLVTGGSGFVAGHVILNLLSAGHRVRTTVRNPNREADVRAALKRGGVEAGERLSFHAADLEKDTGWDRAVAGCEFVQHVASPFPVGVPRDENELIVPAREGTLRVLRAAREAGVKRVVVTSSFAAIGYGQDPRQTPFTEADWTDPEGPDVQAYMKSKTLAERAAWDFVAREGGALELAVVNPVGVFGPALGPDLSSSVALLKALLDGVVPAVPRINFGVVDVRDVADLHLRAMVHPNAAGERFIAVAGKSVSLREVTAILRAGLGAGARKVPRLQLPDSVVRFAALFSRNARQAVPQLNVVRNATSEKARQMLGWNPRSNEEAILATAESLQQLGLLRV